MAQRSTRLLVHANLHNHKQNNVAEQRVRLTQIDSPVQTAVDQKKNWSVLLPVLYLPSRVQFPKDLDKSVQKLGAFLRIWNAYCEPMRHSKTTARNRELRSFVDSFLFISGKQRSNGGGKGRALVGLVDSQGSSAVVRRTCSRGGRALWRDWWPKSVGTSRHPCQLYL